MTRQRVKEGVCKRDLSSISLCCTLSVCRQWAVALDVSQWLVLTVALRRSQAAVIDSCFLRQTSPQSLESLWTAELNDKLLLHTSPYAQLHRLLSRGLKYHQTQTSCWKPWIPFSKHFFAFVFANCFSSLVHISVSVWRWILEFLL